MRFDRKDSCFEQIAARPFQQPRITFCAEDLFVDFACALLFDHVGFDQFTRDPHSKSGDRRILRQGEIENALQPSIGPVHKRLFDHRARDLVADADRYLVVAHGQWHVAAVDVGHERTDRIVGRGVFESFEPQRRLCHFCQLVRTSVHVVDGRPVYLNDLAIRPDQLDRCLLLRHDLDCPGRQLDSLGRRQLYKRCRSERDIGVFDQAKTNRVGAAHVSPQPVARLEDHRTRDGRPPAIHHGFDRNDSLGVRHLANAAVFGQCIAYDKQFFVDGLIHGQDVHFDDRFATRAADGRRRDGT